MTPTPPPEPGAVRAGARPFRLGPEQAETACLLIHGIAGSPHEFSRLAIPLAESGNLCLVVRLPGHGSSPADLRGRRWQEWVAEADAALRLLLQRHRSVFLIGFSMGGAIAILLAARHRQHAGLRGVVAICTPAAPLGAPAIWSGLLALGQRWRGGARPWTARGAGDWTWLGARNSELFASLADREADAARPDRYDSIPLAAALGVLRLVAAARRVLPLMRQPLLLIASRLDFVVSAANATRIQREAGSPWQETLWLERSYHVAPLDLDLPILSGAIEDWMRRVLAIEGVTGPEWTGATVLDRAPAPVDME